MFTGASAVRATPSAAAAPRAQQISSATLPAATPAASVQQLSDFELRMAAVLTAAAAVSDGSGEPTNGGGQRAVSGQRQGEKGVSERDIQWYSGGDLERSRGDILWGDNTAVTDSEGGLGGETVGQCSGGTTVVSSSDSPVGGTEEVQRMWSDSSGSASTGGVQMERNDEGTGGVHRMRDDEGLAAGWQQQVMMEQQQQILWQQQRLCQLQMQHDRVRQPHSALEHHRSQQYAQLHMPQYTTQQQHITAQQDIAQQQHRAATERRWSDRDQQVIVGGLQAKVAELEQKLAQLETGHQWVQEEACKAMGIASKLQVDVDELQQIGSGSGSDGSNSGSYRSARQHKWQSSSYSETESSGYDSISSRRRTGRRVGNRYKQALPKPRPSQEPPVAPAGAASASAPAPVIPALAPVMPIGAAAEPAPVVSAPTEVSALAPAATARSQRASKRATGTQLVQWQIERVAELVAQKELRVAAIAWAGWVSWYSGRAIDRAHTVQAQQLWQIRQQKGSLDRWRGAAVKSQTTIQLAAVIQPVVQSTINQPVVQPAATTLTSMDPLTQLFDELNEELESMCLDPLPMPVDLARWTLRDLHTYFDSAQEAAAAATAPSAQEAATPSVQESATAIVIDSEAPTTMVSPVQEPTATVLPSVVAQVPTATVLPSVLAAGGHTTSIKAADDHTAGNQAAVTDQSTMVAAAGEAAAVVPSMATRVPAAVVPSETAQVPAAAVVPSMTAQAPAAAVVPSMAAQVPAAAMVAAIQPQLQNLEAQVRRLQCELKSAQINQPGFPAPRSSRNRNQPNADGEQQNSADSGVPQGNYHSALAVGTQRYHKHDANSGKVSELRRKSECEWQRIETLLREKLQEIRVERLRQFELMCEGIEQKKFCEHKILFPWAATSTVEFRESWNRHYSMQHTGCGSETNWLHNPELIETEISEALQQEKQYEKCSYRRTACKVLESLVSKYNKVWSYELLAYDLSMRVAYGEATQCKQWTFDQYGLMSEEHIFLVDPGSFWSYDLQRSKVYAERPL